MPNLYIIAGCNGAGKTTASYTILPEILNCKEFVNADNIAAGISPFNPESVAIEAGRIMLKRINELLEEEVQKILEKQAECYPKLKDNFSYTLCENGETKNFELPASEIIKKIIFRQRDFEDGPGPGDQDTKTQ